MTDMYDIRKRFDGPPLKPYPHVEKGEQVPGSVRAVAALECAIGGRPALPRELVENLTLIFLFCLFS
jgi:hypothetical protein